MPFDVLSQCTVKEHFCGKESRLARNNLLLDWIDVGIGIEVILIPG